MSICSHWRQMHLSKPIFVSQIWEVKTGCLNFLSIFHISPAVVWGSGSLCCALWWEHFEKRHQKAFRCWCMWGSPSVVNHLHLNMEEEESGLCVCMWKGRKEGVCVKGQVGLPKLWSLPHSWYLAQTFLSLSYDCHLWMLDGQVQSGIYKQSHPKYYLPPWRPIIQIDHFNGA